MADNIEDFNMFPEFWATGVPSEEIKKSNIKTSPYHEPVATLLDILMLGTPVAPPVYAGSMLKV